MATNILIGKILVPVDGSEASAKSAKYAIDIAKKRKAKLIAIHIMHLPSYALTSTPIEGMPTPAITPIPLKVSDKERKMAEGYLNKIKEMAEKTGVTIETKIIDNQPSIVQAIADIAEKQNCDLIVMGTKGRTGIKKFLLGSVASGVVTYAPCPVLVVR